MAFSLARLHIVGKPSGVYALLVRIVEVSAGFCAWSQRRLACAKQLKDIRIETVLIYEMLGQGEKDLELIV